MKAVQVVQPGEPVEVREVEEPKPDPGDVLIEVHRVGVSFPDLLLSKGQYQLKPELPFTLGVDLSGTVVSAGQSALEVGQRVAAVLPYGGAAERVAVPAQFVFPLPQHTSYDEGAALPMNYLTALFALKARGQVQPGERVLIHGAAGGVGTAAIQVARGLGAIPVAVVSTKEKAELAERAGAGEVVRVDDLATAGKVDVVLDVVGGEVFLPSLRLLNPLGRLLVVGFAAGQGIPEVKVNRLLLNNIDVRGVGWGGYAMVTPGYMQEQWQELEPMLDDGIVRPLIGATYPLEEFGTALADLAQRHSLGKSVVRVR